MLPSELSKVNVESALAVMPIYRLRSITFTSQVAVLLPSFVVTVMVALPNPTAVIFPFASTAATLVSLEPQVTVYQWHFLAKQLELEFQYRQ